MQGFSMLVFKPIEEKPVASSSDDMVLEAVENIKRDVKRFF